MKRFLVAGGVVVVAALVSIRAARVTAQGSPSWPQWAQNAAHTGFLDVTAQNLSKNLANIVYDPLVPQETAATGGDLLVHYQTPLVDGNDVYMESKSGTYTKASYSTQRWHQNKFTWQTVAGVPQLVRIWTFDTDWVAPGSQGDFWEPVYHAALANGFVYDPGAGGTIFKLNKATGQPLARINPFDMIDSNTFTASPLSVDGSGNIFYNVVRITGNSTNTSFYSKDVVDSWLVKVAPDDTVTKVSYTHLLREATIIGDPVPGPNDPCKVQFPRSQLPWPPSPDAVPPAIDCGSQRAGLNVAPAISPDGTIYTVSRAHFVSRYNYLIAVNSDLTGRWASSLRGHLHDGCNDGTVTGSLLPLNGQPGGCRVGAHPGVDPGTNEPGPGRVVDDESSTPTIAPDGTILFGAFTRYNYDQGHLMQFSAAGQFMNAFSFGWDSTPAIYAHDGSYSIVIKNNHYNLGSYCANPAVCPSDRTASNPASPDAFFVTQLSPTLAIEWTFQNTNTLSCTRNPDGTITCVDDGSHPHSFEWCVNAPVVDHNGVVYANSEDGFLYAINQGGTLKQRIFQQQNIGAAYTPASLGSDGKIYSQNAGHLFAVGQ
jgi:outer membrane protein assembly factor BamB